MSHVTSLLQLVQQAHSKRDAERLGRGHGRDICFGRCRTPLVNYVFFWMSVIQEMLSISETSFDLDAIDAQVVGAGIVPVSIDSDNVLRLLLGKERHITHWKGSLKWSGFEGGRKVGETIEHAAAREFVEESMGAVPLLNCIGIPAVEKILLEHRYMFRIVICICGDEPLEKRRYHVSYVVQVPYNQEYIANFAQHRKWLLEAQAKQALLDQALGALHAFGMDIPIEGRPHKDVFVRVVDKVEFAANGVLSLCFTDDEGKTHTHVSDSIPATCGNAYLDWFTLVTFPERRAALDRLVGGLPHLEAWLDAAPRRDKRRLCRKAADRVVDAGRPTRSSSTGWAQEWRIFSRLLLARFAAHPSRARRVRRFYELRAALTSRAFAFQMSFSSSLRARHLAPHSFEISPTRSVGVAALMALPSSIEKRRKLDGAFFFAGGWSADSKATSSSRFRLRSAAFSFQGWRSASVSSFHALPQHFEISHLHRWVGRNDLLAVLVCEGM